jgi:LAO/AO transport system kinase
MEWAALLERAVSGDFRSIAKGISLIENAGPGHEDLLRSLPASTSHRVIGVTGPPGAGKSTLVDSLIGELVSGGRRVAVLCVDPSSPFNFGALLGDRIRMNRWYNHPDVYIRSLATRGSLGGLHPCILEITEFLQACPFDHIVVETVGVGQSEVDIAGLADVTVVVLVPEAGDEIQTMKAGLMEIADVFVVNKADRPDAQLFIRNLHHRIASSSDQAHRDIPVVATVASLGEGIPELAAAIRGKMEEKGAHELHLHLLAERAYHLIQKKRMKDVQKDELRRLIERSIRAGGFNLYAFVEKM